MCGGSPFRFRSLCRSQRRGERRRTSAERVRGRGGAQGAAVAAGGRAERPWVGRGRGGTEGSLGAGRGHTEEGRRGRERREERR
eukprot:scaffold156155_cov17-Tisochrysis_lutea.AAC.1